MTGDDSGNSKPPVYDRRKLITKDAGRRPALQVKTNICLDGPPGRLYIAASLCYALDKMDEKNKLHFGDNLKILRECGA